MSQNKSLSFLVADCCEAANAPSRGFSLSKFLCKGGFCPGGPFRGGSSFWVSFFRTSKRIDCSGAGRCQYRGLNPGARIGILVHNWNRVPKHDRARLYLGV